MHLNLKNLWHPFRDRGNTYNTCCNNFTRSDGWILSNRYKFSRKDLTGGLTFAKRHDNVVPLVLEWALRNGTCPPEPQGDGKETDPYGVCISTNSYCVNASNEAEGYFCNCSKGYTGNPYQNNGCTSMYAFLRLLCYFLKELHFLFVTITPLKL
jgi:hypothetical protein